MIDRQLIFINEFGERWFSPEKAVTMGRNSGEWFD
jgi:hypothetical protein